MIKGQFVDGDKPMISVVVAWEGGVQTPYFVIDTGFTGDLVVPTEVAKNLGLKIDSIVTFGTPGKNIVEVPVATAFASVGEREKLYVTVGVLDGWPLLGISFMEKFNCVAVIDCKNKTVKLEAAD